MIVPSLPRGYKRQLTEFGGYNVWSFGMPEGGKSLQDWWDYYGAQKLAEMERLWEANYRPTAYQSPMIRSLRRVI